MRFDLDEEWKSILAYSWNFRFVVITGLLSGVAAGFQMAQPYLNVRPVIIAIVVGICTTLSTITSFIAGFARIVKQQNLDR